MGRRLKVESPEEDLENFSGGKKLRKWDRAPKVGKTWADRELLGEDEQEEAPPAEVLHIGARLPVRKDLARPEPMSGTSDPKPAAVEDGKEIKLPKIFFDIALGTSIRNTYRSIKGGLALIREIQSPDKKLEFVKGKNRSEINYRLLEKIKLVDPDNEALLAEIKRLNDFQAKEYNLDDLRGKIDSYPLVSALKKSNKPDSEKKAEYEKIARELIGIEVEDIFRLNEIAGPVAELSMHLQSIFGKGLVKVVESEDEGKESDNEERRMKLVQEIVLGEIGSLIEVKSDKQSIAFNIIRRQLEVKKIEMSDDEVGEVVAQFAADRKNIAKGISVLVENELQEKNPPYPEEKIKSPAFINARKKLIEYLNAYLAERKPTGHGEKIKKEELGLTPEEEKLIEALIKAAKEALREEIERSKDWEGKWTSERVFDYFKPVFEANAEQIMETQNLSVEKRSKALRYIFSNLII